MLPFLPFSNFTFVTPDSTQPDQHQSPCLLSLLSKNPMSRVLSFMPKPLVFNSKSRVVPTTLRESHMSPMNPSSSLTCSISATSLWMFKTRLLWSKLVPLLEKFTIGFGKRVKLMAFLQGFVLVLVLVDSELYQLN